MFFPYKVFDNFLEELDLQELSSIKLKDVNDTEKLVYHNRIFKNGHIESSCLKKEVIIRLHNNYHSKALELLKFFAPKKINLYEYSDFHIVIAGKNHSFPIHTDTPNKLLSGVIYLNPLINNGTKIYSKNKKKFFNIEWKKNRALFFARSDNTFHSYSSNGKSNRVTLIYNLMTTDIKGVCRVEKKFFLYLYLLFKMKLKNFILKFLNF